jgi:hypothetical protein
MCVSDTWRIERLEERRLLAVTVTATPQGLLKIAGNGASDTVDIDGTGAPGGVDVFINGGFAGTFAGIKNISATMKGGADVLNLSAVDITGSVTVDMAGGADRVDLDNTTTLGGGPDGDLVIGGGLSIVMGNNAGDVIDWASTGGFGTTVGGSAVLAGAATFNLDGAGGTSSLEASDLNVDGLLQVSSKLASNSFIDDVNVGSTTIISLGKKADSVVILDSRLSGDLEVLMGGGNDLFDLDFSGLAGDASQFDGNVNVLGGGGMDTLDELAANVFATPPSYREFEVFV